MYDQQKAHYVVVTGILVKDGKFLITKRSEKEKAFPGMWTVPGGKLNVDDYSKKRKDTSEHWYNVLEGLLRREVMEEVGLEIKNIGYLTSLVYIRSDNIPTLIISFFAEPEEGDVVLCPELTEHVWVDLKEAKGYHLIEGIYEELEMLYNLLNKGVANKWKIK